MSSDAIPITERELTAMTADLVEMHNDFMTRRGFLAGSGLALGGLLLVACGSNKKSSPKSSSGANANLKSDLQVAALAIALENLAVQTYQAGIAAATAGKVGRVPPAVVTFAKTTQGQHRDHADAWNSVLASAGAKPVTGVDSTVKRAVVDPAFAKVTDVAGLARLALQLEDVAAATYLESLGLLHDAGGIQTAASIHPVEMQHATILRFVLGEAPVPASFGSLTGARPVSDAIG